MLWPCDESIYRIIIWFIKFGGVGGSCFIRKLKNPEDKPDLQLDAGSLNRGHYIVSVISMAGDVLQTEEVQIENEKQELRLSIKNLEAGTYLLHVFNRNTAASYTEEIVVH
jgi:hypothetical protein